MKEARKKTRTQRGTGQCTKARPIEVRRRYVSVDATADSQFWGNGLRANLGPRCLRAAAGPSGTDLTQPKATLASSVSGCWRAALTSPVPPHSPHAGTSPKHAEHVTSRACSASSAQSRPGQTTAANMRKASSPSEMRRRATSPRFINALSYGPCNEVASSLRLCRVRDNSHRGKSRHGSLGEIGLADLRLDEHAVTNDEFANELLALTTNLRVFGDGDRGRRRTRNIRTPPAIRAGDVQAQGSPA